MRMANPFIATILAAVALSTAQAAEKSSDPCSLMRWQDFASLGVTKDTPKTNAGWHQETTPKDLPGSKLFTNMCALSLKNSSGMSSVTLSFDSFLGKVTEQQVRDWLKANTKPTDDTQDGATVALGDSTCETGHYDLPVTQRDGSVQKTVEHYIACDRQVGIHHVSLNVHVPAANKDKLPSPKQAVALLQKSVGRMKTQSFALAGQ